MQVLDVITIIRVQFLNKDTKCNHNEIEKKLWNRNPKK